MEEIWKDVAGYEGRYMVSNFGRVCRIMQQYTNSKGYNVVALSKKDTKIKTCKVHRLVMAAFEGDEPDLQVNHIDGNKSNNVLENLEWCTAEENLEHAYRMGLTAQPRSVICLDTGEIFCSCNAAAKAILGDSRKGGRISRVCNGKRKTVNGLSFAFLGDGDGQS